MRRWHLAVITVTILVTTGLTAAPPQQPTHGRDDVLARFFSPKTPPLVSYRATRHLSATTRGGKMSAWMEARTSLDPKDGFVFDVTAEDGSSLIRGRVLRAALEAEQKAQKSGDGRGAALTTDNYEFLDITGGDPDLLKVDVKPRRKAVMLINGSLFLKPDSSQLVRIEGELAARPSFWTRRVRVIRQDHEIQGVHVPVSMRSTADVLIVGTSTFEMTYKYEEINGAKLEKPTP